MIKNYTKNYSKNSKIYNNRFNKKIVNFWNCKEDMKNNLKYLINSSYKQNSSWKVKGKNVYNWNKNYRKKIK